MAFSEVEAFLTGEPWVPFENRPKLELPSPSERRALFEEGRFDLANRARAQMTRGVSYREFKVGCSVLAWHPTEGPILYDAYNFKPVKKEEKGEAKRCAERNAIRFAEQDGCVKIIAIVTASREKSVSEKYDHDVLHPCEECRSLFRTVPAIDQDTIVYNILDTTPPLPDEEIAQHRKAVMDFVASTSLPLPDNTIIHPPLNTEFDIMAEERTMQELQELYREK
ncbi:MAG: hypothetical protein Q7K39_04450 [Candidatus Magasanikbacteria bacterium]|nr:hypothetical protein [Candidatus Magasanikbacteria bacterium]